MTEVEIVKDRLGNYSANISKNGVPQNGLNLPDCVKYPELKKAIKEKIGIELPGVRELSFEPYWSKQYARIKFGD